MSSSWTCWGPGAHRLQRGVTAVQAAVLPAQPSFLAGKLLAALHRACLRGGSCQEDGPSMAPPAPMPAPVATLPRRSLWDIWNKEGQQLTAQYVACVAVEALTILEALHAKGCAYGASYFAGCLWGRPKWRLFVGACGGGAGSAMFVGRIGGGGACCPCLMPAPAQSAPPGTHLPELN